jgi:hypothetical protein
MAFDTFAEQKARGSMASPHGAETVDAQPKRKKRRIFRWVFLAIQALFIIWIISGVSGASDNCAGETGQALEACQAGTAVGGTIGVFMIVFLWLAVDVILGVGYLIFRKKG